MHKLMVLYPEPLDRVAFEEHYRSVHLPLCEKLPGVREITFSLRVDDGPEPAPYFAVFEAVFDSAEALGAALGSPEGAAVQADVPNYATGGATVLTFAAEELVRV
ncbi:EthD family reductase [Microbacterium sp. SORGH_AS_0888]|uniref:EthD family reductase n=1 Tax=Microbacterium sp. SORGH_AS_0888 TaxID=3041791 RepID=UPI00278602BB|nr:EthD family reductase [Microbacterium sp. SORGH_AS_0888]MDQ1131326.1 uncharacterized protein (TIGR02118 family) [Microbacterium sp. SORGH_AS_0888]